LIVQYVENKLISTMWCKMLSAQDVMKHGFSGKKVGEILKNSKTWSPEQIEHFKNTGEKPVFLKDDLSIKEDSVLEWMIENSCVKGMFSSNSERRRTLNDGHVEINGMKMKADDKFPLNNLKSLVFFKGTQKQCTMM